MKDIYVIKQLQEMSEIMEELGSIYIPKYFKDSEFYNRKKMNKFLLYILDKCRGAFALKYYGVSFNINYSNEPEELVKHSENSLHYTDEAVDMWIRAFHDEELTKQLTYKEIAEALTMFLKITTIWEDIGIGYYPEWNRPGFHLEWSPKQHKEWQAYYKSISEDGKTKIIQDYIAVDKDKW
jgi:hypothetical protein